MNFGFVAQSIGSTYFFFTIILFTSSTSKNKMKLATRFVREIIIVGYVLQFILGGSIMVCASLLSKSKYLFLSGIITLLPIMTLMNLYLQTHNMSIKDFRITQKNAIFGSIGVVVFIGCIFLLTNWLKPIHAVLCALTIYVIYMVSCKFILS